MKQTILLLSVFALLGATVTRAAVTLCPEQNQTDYLNSELTADCAGALTRLRYVVPPQLNSSVPARDPSLFTDVSTDDLDIACQNSCQGNFSSWLREECQDPYTARSIDAMCAPTLHSTDEIGARCRFGFPDALDSRAIFLRIFTQCDFTNPEACFDDPNVESKSDTDSTGDSQSGDPDSTASASDVICRAFDGVVETFGCCYNSLYNDTEFIKYISATGLLNATMMQMVTNLGMSPVWDQCMIEVPPPCEMLGVLPSGASPVVGMASALTFIAVAIAALAVFV